MAIGIVRLGSPRSNANALRLGTVRQPPRGVPKTEFATRDYYDLWLPDLAPSAALLAWARQAPLTAPRWTTFERRYRREMQAPAAARLIALVAALSNRTALEVGCYCEDEARCHRSLLRRLLVDAGAVLEPGSGRES
jgi:uncharacterized protein YeaO (DUF488 family)